MTTRKMNEELSFDEAEFNIVAGEKLRAIRKSKRMTQADVAKLLGVSFQQVQKYESGVNALSSFRLHHCARILECSVHDILPSILGPMDNAGEGI